MQTDRQTHTFTHDKHVSAHTQDTHTNAKGFLMISDRIKRVGSTHWPPYPCKALRLLALMKPLMGSYLNPWMEVTAVWGGAISVDATHTNGQCHIWGEDCVQLGSLNKVELHVQFSSIHNTQYKMYCIQEKNKCTFETDTHPSHSKIHIYSKLVCIFKKLKTRALVCKSKYKA